MACGVSALEPVNIAVDVAQPYDAHIPIDVSATVVDPEAETYGTFDLRLREDGRYVADVPLRLPFEPLPGYWWVIVHVETGLPVTGERALTFEPMPIDFRVLSETLPSAVRLACAGGVRRSDGDGRSVGGWSRVALRGWRGRVVVGTWPDGGSAAQ